MPRILRLPLATLPFGIKGTGSSSSALTLLLQARDAIFSADAAITCLTREDTEDAGECALVDAEVLLSHATSMPRNSLRLNLPKLTLQPQHVAAFNLAVALRCSGTPVPYITRSRHFYNHEFFVTQDVLIPRPETEILVEHALQLAPSLPPSACSSDSAFTFIDLGCGSGKLTPPTHPPPPPTPA
jgi:HemK-like putative methylase